MNKIEEIRDLMRRMGEDISPTSVWDCLINDSPLLIKEGLISSYDSNMVLNAICSSFHLGKNGKRSENIPMKLKGKEYIYIGDAYITTGENDEDIIKITLDTNEEFIKTIEKRMEKYGWSLYRSDVNDNKMVFCFEKRYPECFTARQLLKVVNTLYHVVPNSVINKVLKQGLVPKSSKTLGFVNEPRIYLWLQQMENIDWSEMLKARYSESSTTLRVDLSKLDPEHKFYIDPRIYNALFTLEPITPTAITIVKN